MHTTSCFVCVFAMVSNSKQVFDLVFLPPDSGGFVPVYFSQMDRAIHEPHAANALALTPASGSIDFAQPAYFANSGACCEGLNVGDFAQNLEPHWVILSPLSYTVNYAILGRRGARTDSSLRRT